MRQFADLGEWLIHKVGWGWSFVISSFLAAGMGILVLLFFQGVFAVVIFSICFAFAAFFALSSYIFHKSGDWHDKDTTPRGR